MNELQALLKDLYLISGLNISIFDIDGNVITSYPKEKSPFCKLIGQNKEAIKHCQKCDCEAFQRVKKIGKIDIYQCYFHLYEAAVPLYTYGVHTGYLMMGQTLTTSPFDRQYIKDKALPYINNEKDLDEAIQKISVHSKEQILSFANIIDICAKYITLTNRIEAKHKNLAMEIKKYIVSNYAHDISIENLCEYFYCCKATLINHFKAEYNQTIHQYLLEFRLEKSRDFLKNDELSILEVSSNCGFKDANYFSKAFKKKYNLTPSEYREKNRSLR